MQMFRMNIKRFMIKFVNISRKNKVLSNNTELTVTDTFVRAKVHKWATSWENLFLPYAYNKGTDQPAHPRSLISTFVFAT